MIINIENLMELDNSIIWNCIPDVSGIPSVSGILHTKCQQFLPTAISNKNPIKKVNLIKHMNDLCTETINHY